MDFFVYSSDAPGAAELRLDADLPERHWSYMDGFADSMIARGPTLAADRDTATGSLHVLGLPNVDAARKFVAREPNNLSGVYGKHRVWRFENLLGQTMWEFSSTADEPKFLVIARPRSPTDLQPTPAEALSKQLRERLILYGVLSNLDGSSIVGVGLAIQAPDREAAVVLLGEEQLGLGIAPELEVHDWEFGGRR